MQNVRNAFDSIKTRFGLQRPEPYGPPLPMSTPTPIYITPRTRLILLLLVGVLIYVLATSVPSIVQVFLLGAIVALILSFPVRFLDRFIGRGLAILLVSITALLLLFLLLALLIPFLVSEISRFADSLPATIDSLQDLLRDVLTNFYERGWIDQRPDDMIDDIESTILNAGQEVVSNLLGSVITTLTGSVNILITAFGVIFVAIYLLVDIPTFKDTYVRMWAPAYRGDALDLWDTLGYSLSRYLSGLLVSITIQGTMAFIALSLLGVPYAAVLGLWMSATAVLPYIGAFLGGIPAVLIALTVSWEMALLTVLVYVAINQLEGNLITPRIQGSAVRVHPLFIFFAVIAGSRLFGALGAIMAVPVLAVIRVLIEFFWLRLRVRGDQETLLSAMREDLAQERIVNQSPIADLIEEQSGNGQASANGQ